MSDPPPGDEPPPPAPIGIRNNTNAPATSQNLPNPSSIASQQMGAVAHVSRTLDPRYYSGAAGTTAAGAGGHPIAIAASNAAAGSVNASHGTPQTTNTSAARAAHFPGAAAAGTALFPPSQPTGVPSIPPPGGLGTIPATWTCTNGHVNPATKKRCGTKGCGKWPAGKRGPLKKKAPGEKEAGGQKKKQKKQKKSASTNLASPPVASARPSMVDVTPQGANPSSLSPMTGNESVGGDSVGTGSSLTTLPETNEDIDTLIARDFAERGDSGDSDPEGEGFYTSAELRDALRVSEREQQMGDWDEIETGVADSEDNCYWSERSEQQSTLLGAPEGWLPPAPKEGWSYKPNATKKEPQFEAVDNPGGWSNYTFRAKFAGNRGTGDYMHHAMPAGAKVVPKDPVTGKRTRGDWEFHYNGWKDPENNPDFTRQGATRENLLPGSRSAKLDADVLKKMGLTKDRMVAGDALFFFQLLVPLHDTTKTGINDDPRKSFYTEIADWTNLYALEVKKWGGNYSRPFKQCIAEDIIHFDGIVIRNVNSFVGHSWSTNATDSNRYDPVIAETMKLRRWLDIKACLKYCKFYTEKKRGDPDYDPTEKYRFSWDVPIFNMGHYLEKAGDDTTVDESTWGNASYSDMHNRLMNKPYSKGGQHTLITDARKRYVYGYTPRSKHFKREAPFTREGPAEVKRIIDQINPLVKGQPKEESDKRRQVFNEKPCMGLDNHFSGDVTCNLVGTEGYKLVKTTARDRLPAECGKEYFHHIKQVTVDHRSRMARYEQPIVAVKKVTPPDGKPFNIVHISFQSTGSTNITAVNALSQVQLYVREKNKGQEGSKRIWAIEMNEGRDLYLKLYGGVDKIDQLLKEWGIQYVTWRWWHAPKNHALAITCVMAFQMYEDCASGEVDPDWKVDKPLTHDDFRQKLGEQMCKYTAADRMYPGDQFCHKFTRLSQAKRQQRKKMQIDSLEKCDDDQFRVSYNHFLDAKNPRGRDKIPRLCGDDLEMLKAHLRSFETSGSRGVCQVCGRIAFKVCKLCEQTRNDGKQVYCCFRDPKEEGKTVKENHVSCCMDLHNDYYFGLTLNDRRELFGDHKTGFKKPTKSEIQKNKAHIEKLKKRKMMDDLKNEEE